MNTNKYSKGQSLLELIISVGIFVAVIASLVFFIFDSYLGNRLSYEMTKADFLAEEGLEAARSIRDNNYSDLLVGGHGLAISSGHWIFQGIENDLNSQLNGGKRIIDIVNDPLDQNIKKVTSTVTWKFTENRSEEVKLISYLTNWQKLSGVEIRKPTAYTDRGNKTQYPGRAYDVSGDTFSITKYDINSDPSIIFYTWELPTQTYSSLVLKYRYHADQANGNRYAVAYSVNNNNCSKGTYIDLIPLTSAGASDTTVLVNLFPSQNLAQICLKIYSEKGPGKGEDKYIYSRDIWTEGTY